MLILTTHMLYFQCLFYCADNILRRHITKRYKLKFGKKIENTNKKGEIPLQGFLKKLILLANKKYNLSFEWFK